MMFIIFEQDLIKRRQYMTIKKVLLFFFINVPRKSNTLKISIFFEYPKLLYNFFNLFFGFVSIVNIVTDLLYKTIKN